MNNLLYTAPSSPSWEMICQQLELTDINECYAVLENRLHSLSDQQLLHCFKILGYKVFDDDSKNSFSSLNSDASYREFFADKFAEKLLLFVKLGHSLLPVCKARPVKTLTLIDNASYLSPAFRLGNDLMTGLFKTPKQATPQAVKSLQVLSSIPVNERQATNELAEQGMLTSWQYIVKRAYSKVVEDFVEKNIEFSLQLFALFRLVDRRRAVRKYSATIHETDADGLKTKCGYTLTENWQHPYFKDRERAKKNNYLNFHRRKATPSWSGHACKRCYKREYQFSQNLPEHTISYHDFKTYKFSQEKTSWEQAAVQILTNRLTEKAKIDFKDFSDINADLITLFKQHLRDYLLVKQEEGLNLAEVFYPHGRVKEIVFSQREVEESLDTYFKVLTEIPGATDTAKIKRILAGLEKIF